MFPVFSESSTLLRRGTDPGDPYSYTIYNVDTEDTGLYSCVAGNILGESIQVAFLQVNSDHMLGRTMVLDYYPTTFSLMPAAAYYDAFS